MASGSIFTQNLFWTESWISFEKLTTSCHTAFHSFININACVLYVQTFQFHFHLKPHISMSCHAESFIHSSTSNHFNSGKLFCKLFRCWTEITGFLKKLHAVQISCQSGNFHFLISVITCTKSTGLILSLLNPNSVIFSLIPAYSCAITLN